MNIKTIARRFRAAGLMGAAVSMLAFATGATAQNQNSNGNQWWNGHSNDNPWPYNRPQGYPVLAVVGDIACQPAETEPAGEKGNEACNNPKAPYANTTSSRSSEICNTR